ncbi:hypothetical protein D9M68_723250 [compost metagenome]
MDAFKVAQVHCHRIALVTAGRHHHRPPECRHALEMVVPIRYGREASVQDLVCSHLGVETFNDRSDVCFGNRLRAHRKSALKHVSQMHLFIREQRC